MNPLFPLLFQQNRYLVNELNEALKPHGLFSSQWSILYMLQQRGPLTLTTVWRDLQVEAPTVTRTVTRLEALGLVQRESGVDKREKIVSLTAKATLLIPQVEQSIAAFEERMTTNLTAQEQQQLMGLLQKMKG